MNIEKFKKWLSDRGCEILPLTNDWESLRFKGREVGVLYKSGKTSNLYTRTAIEAFQRNKKWNGKPVNVGRKSSYRKEKVKLIDRDGRDCFFCGGSMEDDITVEHLIALSSGGKNSLDNMVLCHQACNNKVNNMPIGDKVKFAIECRINVKEHY